jgi:hypothetical protein
MTRRDALEWAAGLTLMLALSAASFACYVGTTFDAWPCQTETWAPVCGAASDAFNVGFDAVAEPAGQALCQAEALAEAHARGDAGDRACWWATHSERARAAREEGAP